MARLSAALRWGAAEFGPLIVFLAVSSAYGLKPAIACAIAAILADAAWRKATGRSFTRIYLLSSGLTLIFGAVDLWAANPFMLKYEAVITNLATAAAFVAGARGSRPMLLEIAEQRQGTPFPARPDVVRFFQLFTLLWAAYFVLKAAAYLAAGFYLPLGMAVAVRAIGGGVSLGLMTVLSITQGWRLFNLCQRLRLLPVVPPI
jgi:intracellular septation protein A